MASHGWRKYVFVKGRACLSHSWKSWMAMEGWFLENTKINATFRKSANVNLKHRWFKNVNIKLICRCKIPVCKYAYVNDERIAIIWFCKCIDMRVGNYYSSHWNPVYTSECSYELWMIFRLFAWIWLRKTIYSAICKS